VWRITLKGVVAHKLRYALTALAIVLGVSFMAGTLVLTDTIGRTFDGLYTDIYHSTDAVVRGTQTYNPSNAFTSQRPMIPGSLADTIAAVPGVSAVARVIGGYAQLVGRDGKAIGNPAAGPPTIGEAWVDVPALNPMRLLTGSHAPRADNEVVIDRRSATVGHFKVGDSVVVLSQLPPTSYVISGIATWGNVDSPLGATITIFTPATASRVLGKPGMVNEIDVAAKPGVSQYALVTRIQKALHDSHLEVISGQSITQESQKTVRDALGFFNTFLLIFALIALFVGSFLIFNTFSITVAQRVRELALLRAVGASRGQITSSVVGEALMIGLVASALGLGVGIALAAGLKALLKVIGIDIPATGLVVTPRTILVAVVAGTVITVLSALMPARRAARVPPVAAMQDVVVEPQSPSSTRALSGAVVTFVGAGALAIGLFTKVGSRVGFVGGGAAATFLGIAILGPLMARPVSRLLGAPLAWRSTTGRLAQENAVRNPARTSSTASALMIGVAIVALMAIVASSTKASINSIIDSSMKADFVISSGDVTGVTGGFSPTLQQQLSQLPEVSTALAIRSGFAQIYGTTATLQAADPKGILDLFNVGVTSGNVSTMGAHDIAVSTQVANDRHLAIGSVVKVIFPTTGHQSFTVRAIYKGRETAGDFFVPLAVAQANFPQQLDVQEYVKLAPGVSAATGRHALESVLNSYPTAALLDQAQYKTQQAKQIDQMLNLVYGLLALAVLIALIGIANTLALSTYERTRELGLLRAVGMTRGQLRATVRKESLIISLLGSLEGLVVGLLFGWAMVRSLSPQGITHLVIPVVQLVVVTALAGVAGVIAAVAPGRRAARIDVLRAISAE
jgi:putative ABC transport system permease protein